MEYKIEQTIEREGSTSEQVRPVGKGRRPVVAGVMFSQSVADYILEIYPDVLESDMDMSDLLRMINGLD